MKSPAYKVLSLSARRVLDRLEIELAAHGGMDNGLLPVTYDDFVVYGIDRHAIAPAIRELEALGLVEVTVRGHGGNAGFRTPNKFRITYRPTKDAAPTHEWNRIHTDEQAEKIARDARLPRPRTMTGNRKPVRKNSHSSEENPHLPPVIESLTTVSGEKPTLLSISRGGGARAAG